MSGVHSRTSGLKIVSPGKKRTRKKPLGTVINISRKYDTDDVRVERRKTDRGWVLNLKVNKSDVVIVNGVEH